MRALVGFAFLLAGGIGSEEPGPIPVRTPEFEARKFLDRPLPNPEGFEVGSFFVTFPDGVEVAADLYKPKGGAEGRRFPTILETTSTGRRRESNATEEIPSYFAARGFAFLRVDTRGTGASFGKRSDLFGVGDPRDGAALLDWIVSQAWSDGRVVLWGEFLSAPGALRLAARKHPAIRAAVVRFFAWDLFRDLTHPGGMLCAASVDRLEGLLGRDGGGVSRAPIARVGSDADGARLREALESHSEDSDAFDRLRGIVFRDDETAERWLDGLSPRDFAAELGESRVPLFLWGSWFEVATAQAVLEAIRDLPGEVNGVIGPWSLLGRNLSTPYASSESVAEARWLEQLEECRQFFLSRLDGEREKSGGRDSELLHYRLGEGVWVGGRLDTLAGRERRYHLTTDFSLADAPVEADEGEGDRYMVDYGVTTGSRSRWSGSSLGVEYGDRDGEELGLLTYTSLPLESDLVLFGEPQVVLFLRCDGEDAAMFVYLEEVDEEGRVLYLTEGNLRLLHRLEATPDRALPQRTFRGADARKLKPDEVERVRISLRPISVRIRAGRRIRLALAGHDADSFVRIPEEGQPIFTVERTRRSPSFLSLPEVRER